MTTPSSIRYTFFCLAAIPLGMIGSGCGDGITLVPAAGTVTLDGKPLEGATLSFVPAMGNSVSTAGTDVTGPEGNFSMTYNGRAGLSPGKYKVMLSKTEEIESKAKKVPDVFAKASFEKKLMGMVKETIPPQKLEKEIDVPAGGAKDFALDFKSKGKKGSK
ncbi:carboxypeptidase-like regulatory domain-containing protein [Singulisphaera rosea]